MTTFPANVGLSTDERTLVLHTAGADISELLAFGFRSTHVQETATPFSFERKRNKQVIVALTKADSEVSIPVGFHSDVPVHVMVVPPLQADPALKVDAELAVANAAVAELQRENKRLQRIADESEAHRADASELQRKYDALSNSKLGQATVRYWDVRKKLRRK